MLVDVGRVPAVLGDMGQVEVVSISVGRVLRNSARCWTLMAESDRSVVEIAQVRHPHQRRKSSATDLTRDALHTCLTLRLHSQNQSWAVGPKLAEGSPEFDSNWPAYGRKPRRFWNPSRSSTSGRPRANIYQTQPKFGRTQPTLVDRGRDLVSPHLVKPSPNLAEPKHAFGRARPKSGRNQAHLGRDCGRR